MSEPNGIKLFENKQIRAVWDEQLEKWFFSVSDIVEALTDSADVKQYIKKMRSRDEQLNLRWGTICTPTEMMASDGKIYKTNAADMEGVLRLIQSIPSPKAEPFKQWLAQVGSERLDETADPELAIARALQSYLRMGYSPEWVNQRLKSIEIRKELADEWERRGVQQGQQFAILTDIVTKAWSDKTTREYKQHKGLTKQNLRDNMTNAELVLNMLAELSTTEISKEKQPTSFAENRKVAQQGGDVAKVAREQLEAATGKPVVTAQSAADLRALKPSDEE